MSNDRRDFIEDLGADFEGAQNRLDVLSGETPSNDNDQDNQPVSKVIIVSTRVPDPEKPMSGGMAPQVRASCKYFDEAIWYGVGNGGKIEPGFMSAEFSSSANGRSMVTEYEKDGILIRRISTDEHNWDGHYNNFSNQFLWPMNHDFPDIVEVPAFTDISAIGIVNNYLARQIAEDVINSGDTQTPIWVHDYHHMNLPHLLRLKGVENPIVFFNHTPLPSPETLDAVGQEGKRIFESYVAELKHADAVLLQSGETVRRFMQIIGETPQDLDAFEKAYIDRGDDYETPLVVGNYPISTNVPDVARKAVLGELQTNAAKELSEQLVADNIFIDFARADYSKGLVEKAKAFQILMQQQPELQGRAQLVIGAEPTRTDIPAYVEYSKKLKDIAEEINADETLWINGKPPVVVLPQHIPHEDVVQLLRNDPNKPHQRKIGTIAAWRDGMNLVCKEFMVAQDPDNAGVLLLSAQAGAGQEKGFAQYAVTFEPDLNNMQNLVDAMSLAIQTPQDIANQCARDAQEYLNTHDLDRWAQENVAVMNSDRHAENRSLRSANKPPAPPI